ncbi:hypothetical protein ES703_111358 [subsurface metagenome]
MSTSFQSLEHLGCGLRPCLGILCQKREDGAGDRFGDLRTQAYRIGGCFIHKLRPDLLVVLTLKWEDTGKHLIQDDPHAPQI